LTSEKDTIRVEK